MGQLNIPGTSIIYLNPKQVDQKTLVFPPGITNMRVSSDVAGATWKPNFAMAVPQPGTFDANPPIANPIVFRNPG